jgi:hypothetical protein
MATDIIKAIQGFSAENAGKKEHEGNIALLARVKADIERGKGSNTSIGSREATAAAQRNMPAETGHDGGKGETKTNEPGSANPGDRAADVQEESKGPMTSAGPPPSDGHLTSNMTAAAMPGGVVDMRRMAAMKELEKGPTSEGNKESNSPGKAMANEKRIGDVKAAAKSPGDKNTEGDGFEGVPPFAKESLGGDGWGKAAQKARQMYAAKK